MWGVTSCAVREWRKGNGLQSGTVYTAEQVHNHNTSPTVSASRKKQKMSKSVASLSLGAPSPTVRRPMQPSPSTIKHGPPSGTQTKKQKTVSLLVLGYQENKIPSYTSSMVIVSLAQIKLKNIDSCISLKSIQFPSSGLTSRSQVTNQGGSSGAFAAKGPAEGASYDPCIGRKIWTRWPEDNHFYEAVITDYNSAEVRL